MDQPLEDLPEITIKQIGYKDKIEFYRKQEEELITQRSQIKSRLKICQMPSQHRYNKLKTESKLLMNVIRMICYRAESSAELTRLLNQTETIFPGTDLKMIFQITANLDRAG